MVKSLLPKKLTEKEKRRRGKIIRKRITKL